MDKLKITVNIHIVQVEAWGRVFGVERRPRDVLKKYLTESEDLDMAWDEIQQTIGAYLRNEYERAR